MSERAKHSARLASLLTEGRIKSPLPAPQRCRDVCVGGEALSPPGFPFIIKALLSCEIQDTILHRERYKEHPSAESVGRARKGSHGSIRSANQSSTKVNLAWVTLSCRGGCRKPDMKATWCGGMCPHGSGVMAGWCVSAHQGAPSLELKKMCAHTLQPHTVSASPTF